MEIQDSEHPAPLHRAASEKERAEARTGWYRVDVGKGPVFFCIWCEDS
jgi:hypothetical protein